MGVQIDDAFATRLNLSGTSPTEETSFDPPPPREAPALPPMSAAPGVYPVYGSGVPTSPHDTRPQMADVQFRAYQPQPAPTAPFPMAAAPAPYEPAPAAREESPGYFASLWSRRRDAQKLLVLALMVTLGVGLHWLLSHYVAGWVQSCAVSSRQEFLLRAAYPLAVFLLAWNAKTFVL